VDLIAEIAGSMLQAVVITLSLSERCIMRHSTPASSPNLAHFFCAKPYFTFLAMACAALLFSTSLHAQTAGRHFLRGQVPAAVADARPLHEMAATKRLNLAIGLPLRNQAQLETLISQISDPSSPNYHHYLTAKQFAAQFGPTEADYQSMVDFAQQHGLTVTRTKASRMVLDVSGQVPDVENTFHVKMMVYQHPTRGQFYAPDREPSIDSDVNVVHVSGLSDFQPPQPMDIVTQPISAAVQPDATGSGPGGDLIGGDFRAAYAPGVTLTGSGQSVALVEFDGFYAKDVAANFAKAGVAPVPVQTVLLDGFNGTPGTANIEVTLDIMMAAYMAPDLSSVISYEGEYPADVLSQIADDDKARQISCSWQYGDNPTLDELYEQLAVQGQSFLTASGDSGSMIIYGPSDDPYVTVVGGTSLNTGGAGGPWSSETTWNNSGGGISPTYTIPSYQQGISMAANHGSTTNRNFPDVSMVGNGQIYLIYNNGAAATVQGTSISAPLWAGFTALVNQQAAAANKGPVGFLNPAIYAIGNSGNYTEDFHDITQGSNGGYTAVTGYDLVTGWGSPTGQHLIDDLSQTTSGSFTLAVANPSLTLPLGSSASTMVTIKPGSGFEGTVGLTAKSLPAGVSATFAPNGDTSPVTFTANSSATPGTYSVTVTGTNGDATSSAPVSLTIPQAAFTLSASASSLSVQPGGSNVTSTIGVVGANGFNSSVNFAVSGLPSGMTASFSAAGSKTSTVLTLDPTASLVPGTYNVVVTGTSGSATASTTIVVNASGSSFGLSASASSLTVMVDGSHATSIISVTDPVGLSGKVALAVSGAPSGMTAALSTTSTSSTSTLTVTPSATLAPGTYTLKISGTQGNTTASTPVTVVVPTPSFGLSSSASNVTLLVGSSHAIITIDVTNPTGLSGPVNLSLSGVPSGMTGSLSATSTSSGVTLILTSSASAVPGTYPVTVSGVSGTASGSTTITVTVPGPSFGLSSSASSVTLPSAGSHATSTIAVTNAQGLSSPVSLSVSGVPAGVTAALSTASTATSSALTLSLTGTAAPGTYGVVVSGISASASASVTIPVTISATASVSFGLSALPNNITLAVGGSHVTSTIALTNASGLSGNVNLTLSGVPAGVTAGLSATSIRSSSTLTLTPTADAVPGTYVVTVTGTTSTTSASVPITVTVVAPSFGLSSSVTSATLQQEASSHSLVTIDVINKVAISGGISLSVSGAPAGVTAALSSTSTLSGVSLIITSSSSAVPGTYTVTVLGTCDGTSASVSIPITVQ
jgi:uncharacterized membrane protein